MLQDRAFRGPSRRRDIGKPFTERSFERGRSFLLYSIRHPHPDSRRARYAYRSDSAGKTTCRRGWAENCRRRRHFLGDQIIELRVHSHDKIGVGRPHRQIVDLLWILLQIIELQIVMR